MPIGLPVAFLLFAQTSSAEAATAPAAVSSAPAPPGSSQRDCIAQDKDPSANQIAICAPKPQGYRLPPDIVEARRLKKHGDTVRPHNPHETYADHSCATVGPMGCRGTPTLNLIAVAAVAAKIGQRLSNGQEVGTVFETTPELERISILPRGQEAPRRKGGRGRRGKGESGGANGSKQDVAVTGR